MKIEGQEWVVVDTYLSLKEVSAIPHNPESNQIRYYAKDKAGVSAFYFLDDAGVEHEIGAAIITDHGLLLGLADDDHPQYHNDARALTWLGTKSTTNLPEGSNLYYTDARADARVALNHGSAWSVMTNGDPVTPEVVFDSNGDVIMTETLR